MGEIWAARLVAGGWLGGICTLPWGCGLQPYPEPQQHASGFTLSGRDVVRKEWEWEAPGVCLGRDKESQGCCPTRDVE